MTQALLDFADDEAADRAGVEWTLRCCVSQDEVDRLREAAEELGLTASWRRRRKELQRQEGRK